MSEIKFKLVDGDPVCVDSCPEWGINAHVEPCCSAPFFKREDNVCIPGLHQQRDELRREICEDWNVVEDPKTFAAARGWEYLYREFEAKCRVTGPCPDCGPGCKILEAGVLYCGKCKRILLEE